MENVTVVANVAHRPQILRRLAALNRRAAGAAELEWPPARPTWSGCLSLLRTVYRRLPIPPAQKLWLRNRLLRAPRAAPARPESTLFFDETAPGAAAKAALSRRLCAFPLFSAADYRALHPDLAASGVDPLEHFVRDGVWERRPFAHPETIRRRVEALGDVGAMEGEPSRADLRGREIGIHVSTLGNFFMREIADLLAADLAGAGAHVVRGDERCDPAARKRDCIIVAPHEFFLLGEGRGWARGDIVASTILYATEQPGTRWFRAGLPYVLASRGVIESNQQAWEVFRASGLPALFYFPGHAPEPPAEPEASLAGHPLVRALPPAARGFDPATDPWSARPIDIAYIGAESHRREAFLAGSAGFLAAHTCFIHNVRGHGTPLIAAGETDPRPSLNRYVCGRSKIVLNLHQDEAAYFEWHRIVVQGMWNGALVVSETCLPHPLFRPGTHYLEAPMAELPALLEWLLHAPAGQAMARRILDNARSVLASEASRAAMGARLAGFLTRHDH